MARAGEFALIVQGISADCARRMRGERPPRKDSSPRGVHLLDFLQHPACERMDRVNVEVPATGVTCVKSSGRLKDVEP